jgi:hypothetical protein
MSLLGTLPKEVCDLLSLNRRTGIRRAFELPDPHREAVVPTIAMQGNQRVLGGVLAVRMWGA